MSNNSIIDPPMNIDGALRRHLISMMDAVKRLQGQIAVSAIPPTFTVTPKAGGNKLNWTRSDATTYTVYWATTPDFDKSNSVDVGQSAEWTDEVGQVAVTRWYWVRGKTNGVLGILSDAQSGTTLALNVAITAPTPPGGSNNAAIDQTTGLAIDGSYRGGKYEPL